MATPIKIDLEPDGVKELWGAFEALGGDVVRLFELLELLEV